MATILIVEDNQKVGRLLSRLLEKRGGVKVAAVVESAEAALAELARLNHGSDASFPDLTLIDVSLPGMSGIELVAELARLYPKLPCLMLSAHSDPKYVRQALDSGAHGYVAKGDPPVILQAVTRVLEGELYLSEGMRRAMDA